MTNVILWKDMHKDWDENAKLRGFVETKRISLYEDDDQLPQSLDCITKAPCLLFEVLFYL